MGYICLKTTFLHLKHYSRLTCGLENDMRNMAIFFKALKTGIWMGFFNRNLKKYELKIHRGVIRQDNEELCKF